MNEKALTVGVPLAVAAVAVGIAISSSASVAIYTKGVLGAWNEVEQTRMSAIVSGCWPEALAQAEIICLVAGKDDEAGQYFVYIRGNQRLTRSQAKDELRAGRALGAGATRQREERCQLTGQKLAILRGVEAAQFGKGILSRLCAERTPSGWGWTTSIGIELVDEDEVITRAEKGETVIPVPVLK